MFDIYDDNDLSPTEDAISGIDQDPLQALARSLALCCCALDLRGASLMSRLQDIKIQICLVRPTGTSAIDDRLADLSLEETVHTASLGRVPTDVVRPNQQLFINALEARASLRDAVYCFRDLFDDTPPEQQVSLCHSFPIEPWFEKCSIEFDDPFSTCMDPVCELYSSLYDEGT